MAIRSVQTEHNNSHEDMQVQVDELTQENKVLRAQCELYKVQQSKLPLQSQITLIAVHYCGECYANDSVLIGLFNDPLIVASVLLKLTKALSVQDYEFYETFDMQIKISLQDQYFVVIEDDQYDPSKIFCTHKEAEACLKSLPGPEQNRFYIIKEITTNQDYTDDVLNSFIQQ